MAVPRRRSKHVFNGPPENVASFRRRHWKEIMKADSKPGVTEKISEKIHKTLSNKGMKEKRKLSRLFELSAEEAENCLWANAKVGGTGDNFKDPKVHDRYFAKYYTNALWENIRAHVPEGEKKELWRKVIEAHKREGKYVKLDSI